jgi:hypothetical protein
VVEEATAAAGLMLVVGLGRVVQEEVAAVLVGAVHEARLVEAVVETVAGAHLVEGRAAVVVVVGALGRVEAVGEAAQGARLVEAVVEAVVGAHLVEGRAVVVVVVGALGQVEAVGADPCQYLALAHQCPHPRMEVEGESRRLFHRDNPSQVALKVVGQGVKYSVLSELAVITILFKQH